MASTISFSGLSASGLDTSSWVDALVSVKQQTITSLEQQKAEKENLLSIVNNIKSYFSSFQTCLQKITDSQYGIASMDLFMQNLALSSNSSIATATATTEAARQSYDVAVDSLATATKATSGYSQFEVKTADLNTTFGTLGGKNGTITVNSQSFNVTTEDTLQNLIDKFKNVGVDAKFDESKGTFTIGMDLNKIDEGATNLKNALKLANNNVSGAVSGSVVYANRNTEFYKLGLNGGDINIEGVKHTITKNGNNYTIQKDGGAAVQMNTLGEFLDYLKSSAVGADDATVDTKGHITIKGATLDKVEGGTNLMDVLNLIESQKRTVSESGALSYIEVRVADLNTKLSALGITGDTTLVAGGTNNTISNDKTLGDIKNILKNAGVDMSVDSRGIITIDTHGNEISGTLLDVLNLDPTKGGTTISSSAHQATLKADGNTKLSELGITTDKKYIAYKSDGTALTTEISNVEGKTVNEFVNSLKNSGLDAKFDEKTHQITIKDGYIEGSLADALGMTQLSTSFTENASLNTQLEKLGATGDSTLTIDGGAAKTYDKNTTLETVFNDIKNAGGKVTFKDGNVTIEGVTLGGSLPSLLGLDATTQGTSVTSGILTAVTGSTSSGGNTESTVEHNIELSTKLGDITGTTSNYTLKVGDGTSTTYTKDSTLQDIKTQIEGAGGKFTINDDNTISIEGVTMSGTVVGALGFDELATGTKFTTVDAVMISGTSNVATGGTTLGNLGLIASGSTSGARAVRRAPANPNKTLSINGGTAKTYGADSSLDDIFADIVAAGGTASINSEGYIVINGVHLEGTLVDALGLVETSYKTTITSGDLKVTTSTKSTSSSTLYTDTKGDIAWDSTIGSIVGDTNSYDLKVNGTNKTYNTNTKLSDIKNVIQAAGGTMTINDDNTISINGVEISGSLVDKLGFNSDGVHTVVSSNNPIYYTDGKKSADTGTTFEQLGIGADKRDYAIYKNDGTVVKASSTNGTSSGKTIGDWLRVVNDSLNTANGTRDITYASINNGVISITGGYVTGSLPTELGIGTKETVTGITMEGSSVSYVEYEPLKYIGNIQTGSGIAGGTMVSSGFMAESIQYQDELGNIHAVTETTKLSEVLDTSGNKIGSGSYTFNVGSYTKTFDADSTTLGDIVNYVNNLNMDTTHDTTTSATLVDGKLTIESNVSITGTLLDKLGFEKQDISTVAYEIKGTNKAHYSSVDSTTYTASGFTKATETKTGNVTTVSLELPSGFATSLNIVDTSDAISLSSISSISGLTNGTKYTISTKDDLVKLAEFSQSWSKYTTNNITFILANDIDMSGVTDFAGIANFYGIFSGNGHVIKNVTINGSLTVGLFKQSEGTIQDLGLENANVTHAENTTNTRYYVGALVGQNNGNIRNCYVNNSTVTAKSGVQYAGGLVGCNEGKVTYSWTNVNVQRANTRTYMGGFVGENMDYSGTSGTIISNCFSVSNLQSGTTQSFSGGMYGSTVSNCFSVGVNGGVCGSTATVIEYSHYSNAYADDNEKITSGSLVSLKSKIDALGFDNLNWNVEEKELRVSEADSFEVGMTYHISTVADLQKLSSYSNTRNSSGINGIDKGVNFVLDNDIDMSSVSNFVGIANFKGNFYGNGHVIKNLKISESGSGGYVGLFKALDYGTVQDLGLENVTITTNNSYGYTPRQMTVGALVGELCMGKIENCYVSGGTISGNATYMGGLVGSNKWNGSTISDCWANVTVNKTSYSKDKIGAVGGLVAISGGSISNSYSLGDVNSAYGYVGGFVGIATGTISNSFSTGNVKVTNSSSSNTTYTGGFAGAFGMTSTMRNDYQLDDRDVTVTMSNNYSTGTVTASKGSVGGFVGTIITSSSGTKSSDYTMSNNFSDSGSASKAIGSGSVSGISAVANSEINSGISGLGFSNLTMTEVVSEHTATTSTTIKDLMGKGGEQSFSFADFSGAMPSSRDIKFAETDTIQTVIDKLKEFGFDEVDLVDGIFRIKDDKQGWFYGSSELVNKLFGGDDRTYGAEGPQVTYQVTQSSVGGYTGNKITYTTTTTGTVGSVTGSQLSYTTSGTGTAGSVTGNKVTYETTGAGTVGSVTGDKLTYTVSTADGSIVSNEMLYKKLANNSMSISGNKVTYTGTGTGSTGSVTGNQLTYTKTTTTNGLYSNRNFVANTQIYGDSSIYQSERLHWSLNANTTIQEILFYETFEELQAENNLLNVNGVAVEGLSADMTIGQLCQKMGWIYNNGVVTIAADTKTTYKGGILEGIFGHYYIELDPSNTPTKTYVSSVTGPLVEGQTYYIKSATDLMKIGGATEGITFVLDADIDMEGNGGWISEFKGTFYGNGHKISNLGGALFSTISGSAIVKDIGVENSYLVDGSAFANVIEGNAKVENCYVKNGTIELSSSCSNKFIGGFAGEIKDNAIVSNSFADVNIVLEKYGYVQCLGGFVGRASKNAQIDHSYSSGSIKIFPEASVFGVGGFAGVLSDTVSVSDSYSTLDMSNAKVVDAHKYGSFVGVAGGINYGGGVENEAFSGSIKNVYTTDETKIAGMVSGGTFENVIYNKAAEGELIYGTATDAISLPSTALTTSQMQDATTMQGHGFTVENGWYFVGGGESSFIETSASSMQMTVPATGTTKMSELGITDFTVNGSALSGITGDSTVDDVLSKLKSTYGLSEATISDGKITLSSTTDTTLSGNLIKSLMGQDSVTITPTAGDTTTHTAKGTTKMSELGITDFTINGEALSGINANSTVVEVFTALKNEYGIEASISNGIVTFSATSDNCLEGEIINKFFGSKAVEFSTGLNGNSIKSNKVQYSTIETTSSDVYNPFDILPDSTNNTKIFDLYVQSMASPSGKKISSGSITVGSVSFTINASTTVADLKRFLAGEDCYLDSIDGAGTSLYNIVSNNGASVSVSGDIANDVGGSFIGSLCTKSTVSAEETVNHNIDNNTTIGQIFGDTASHTIKVGDETVTLQSTDKLSTLVSKLADKGVTAEIKNSALYLTTSNSTVFSGDIISRFFGQDKVIAGGSTYKYVDIELSTKFSDMEWDANPVFEVDGTKIDGLTKDSTIQDLFNKLASKGINASLSNGKITLTSDTEHTLTGTAVEDFFGGAVTVGSSGGATSKTYSGSVLKTVSKGYTTDTKLVDIDSSYKGTKMYVYKENSLTSGTGTTPVRPGTSGTSGKPGNSVDMNENNLKPVYERVAALSIDSNTTIQDVIDFYNPYLDDKIQNVFKPLNKYSLDDGTITLAFKSGYSDKSFYSADETTLSFGTTTPTVATTSTKLYELETSPEIVASIKVTNNGNKYSFDAGSDGTDSPTIQDVLDFLNNTAGCTATFTDGKLTVTGASDLEFEKPTTTGKIYDMSVLFGGSMPTPTTSGGSGSTGGSSTQTATGTTKMSELGITDFTVNGSALSGITSSSTVNDVLAKLKSTYGLSDATISDGKITLKSDTNTTLSGNLIKGLMGQDSVTITPTTGDTTTTKTYTGTKVTYGATPATGYTTDTKLSTIKSRWVGKRIYVKSSEYTGSTTGYPGNSILFQYMDITNTTTIDDVIKFFDKSAGVMKATYDQTSGELKLRLNVDYSVSAPFIQCVGDDQLIGQLATKVYSFGKTGGSSGSPMTADTTLNDLFVGTAGENTITVTNNGTTTSFDVSQSTNLLGIISNLQSVGCTASITDGVLTVTGGEDLEFGGNTTVWKSIFGGSIPTPTTSTTGSTGGGSTGSTITVTATGSTTLGQLGFNFENTSLFVDGNTVYEYKDPTGGFLSQIISEGTTIDKILSALQDQFGITGSITDGKVTLTSDTEHTLTGTVIKKLFGQDSVTITPIAGGSSTQTATGSTKMSELGITDFKVNGSALSGITSSSTVNDVLAKLKSTYGLSEATISDGKITLKSNSNTTLSGNLIKGLMGQDSITITPTSGGSSINTATEDTTFIDLGYSNGSCPEFKVDGSQITITSSNTIKNLLTLLERDYGITGSITDGKITLSSDTQHTLTGEAVNKLFGQDSVTISPDTSTTTQTADTTTKLGASGLGLTSFDLTIEPPGDAESISISGLNGDSTIGDVFKKLAEKGITASMNNGVITLTSNTPCDLTGTIAEKLFGNDIVSLECADEIHNFTMTQVSGTKYQYVSRDLTSYSGAERVSEVSELVAGNKYHISSAEDLVALANFVKNGADTTGSIFMFDNDIDMSGITGFEGIGTLENAFKGTVYGNGHVVENMTINTTSIVVGLFGYTNQATIKDLGVVDANVTGDSYTGILVGKAENSQISNVYTSGTVTSNDAFVGGLVGDLTDSTATNVYSTADVKGSAAVGGLIGFSDGSIVEKAFATGKVTATDGQVGGLIGAMSNGGTVKNSYATGDVNGKVDVGGFVGVISVGSITTTFDTVYSTSRVSGSQYVGGFIGFVDTDVTTNIKNAVYNRSTGVDAIGGGSATGILGKDYEQMIQKSIMQNAGFTEDKGWVYTTNSTPTFGNTTVTGGGKTYLDSSITSLSSGSTYYISTLEQLNNLATLVNNGADTSGVNFVLDNDIDVSSFTNTIMDFEGTFYGNGHSLTGLKTALFDEVIGNAIVRDLALENMSGVGHLANTVMDNSTVDNVYSTGSTNDNAGLICSLEGNATLKNSYSTANIIVNGAYAGGLVSGMRDNATIEHCFAKNTIEQKFTSMAMGAMAGGLVGIVSGGTIKSSYADCNINVVKYSIHNTVAGGLIGGVSGDVTIENCYATGSRTAVETGMFIGMNNGRVTSIGNVACTGSSISGTPSGFSDGVTFVSNAELNSQAKMEELGFTKDKGWVYYTGKAPMLQGKDTSSAGTTFQMSDTTTLDSICQNRENKTLSVTINGETHSKTFKGSDTVGDVANWLNGIDGVTANISNNKFNISGTSQDFRVDGELADVLFGNNKTTTKQTITENTDSNGLIVGGGQKKIDDNTTVGQLLGVTSGKYAITYIDDSGNLQSGKFSSDEKLSEVLKFLNDNGFQASIVNGVFTATKDGKIATNISGTIGEKLKGENGTVTNTSSGYKTGQLDASSSTKATATTKLADLGIASGSIFIKDNNNNTLGTIQIDNSMTIDDTAQLLANYGFTLGITDGKVTIEGNGTNRIADGTSNLVSQMKFNNWIETKDKLKTDSTVAQMGFGKGSTLGLVLDKKTYNLTFDANATLQDIIDTLGTYGVTASVDSDGKFTATASGNLVLTNELGAYLTKNSAEGYVKEADGYKSKDPLEFKGDKVKLDYDSKVGDILGTGKDGVLRLTLNKDTVVDLTYKADDTMADIIADLKGYGITATIDDGVLKATSNEKTFRFSGEIGKIISGDTPQYDDISTGYVSKDLSYETTNKTNMNNTLKEMGVSSGQIHVLSNDGKIVSTLDIDNSYTVAQVKSLLQPFGMTLSVDENGKFTVASAEGYKLSDSTSNMVSKMGLNNWTTATEKLTGATTLAQMGFKDGADLNLFLDGIVMNVLSFDANQTVDDIIFGLAAYGIDASVNADGQFTATSKSHTFIMSGGLGSYLTKGTGGYVNSDTAYESYKPLVESKDYVETASKNLDYNKLMTENSTLESLGFSQGGTVRVMLDGKTPYTLQFLATDKVQDVIYALSAYGINAEVKDGRFVAESVNNTFTLTGNLGSYLVQGGAYQNEITGYESNPLTYETTEKLTNDTKLSDLGITRGDINVIKDGKVTDTIHISDNTTIGQLFSAIKPYGMTGEIVTKANGDTSIRISAESDIKLADGTSNVVSGLGLQEVRKGDFEGIKKYWDDDATSGLITEDTLLSTLDRNGFIAQGSLIFNTGEGDDAIQHIINISANETVGSLLKKFNDSGIKATLDDGVIKLTGGLDKLEFTGGTSGLVETIGLDIHNIDKYASSSSALTYEGETHYSASNFANANTKLDIVNATDGNMSIFVDGIKCNIEVKSSDSFADLFKKIKDKVKARTGLDIQAGFKTKDGSISANPNDANNTGIIGLEIEKGHELVVGASNDTTNFATIANLNKTDYNAVTGSRALYRVNVNSLITESGLYRDGDITEGTFKIGDAEFTIDSTTTLASLINQINKNDKAYANAYWDTLAGTLVIESTVTGASLINIEAGTSNFTDIMGFTKTKDGVSALVTDSQTLGQNAVVRINGTTVTSATNVITSDISKIKGLTINLKNVSAGETVTISVEQDKEAIYSAVSDTLDAYNTMMEALGKELADKNSLGGESILKLMRNNLKRLMTSSLTGAYVFKNLASVGISTGEASDKISTNVTSLLIDKDKFMDALNTDSDAVQDLLVGTKANPGIFLQANNIVESSINTEGYFSNMANTLTKSISNIEKKISKNNLAIENYRTKLETKFHNMELTISGLQSAYANILK